MDHPDSPDFESGLVQEPLLAFGCAQTHVDPKTGLALYGPYTPPGQLQPIVTTIVVGIVGPPAMIADAHHWLTACTKPLFNDGAQPLSRPHFPGFNRSGPFRCDLLFGDTWVESIKEHEIEKALATVDFRSRVDHVVNLYIRAIHNLAIREPHPTVILCCIPDPVIKHCATSRTRVERGRRSSHHRSLWHAAHIGQIYFSFAQPDTTLGIEGQSPAEYNLRRKLKAEAMRYGIPSQLVWPETLSLGPSPEERRSLQDVATRAWNFTTALYYKAGAAPWRLAEVEPGVCFVGISFYRELSSGDLRMRTSLAQMFTAAGEGYLLRGSTFPWDETRKGKSPHLDGDSANALIRNVIQLYRAQNRGQTPTRLVVHKTSRYWPDELAGFQEACQEVPSKDFVTLGQRGIQFFRAGDYPPLRGTYVKFSPSNLLLYTAGYIPFLNTYPGARAPQPLEILEHHGDSPWITVLRDILALTKLNWNTTDFACTDPITTVFSRRVGAILAELPPDSPYRQEYRFYM